MANEAKSARYRSLLRTTVGLDTGRVFFLRSAVPLSSYPFVVQISCRKCSRDGSYRLARLADKYGSEMTLINLLALLSADCRLREKEGRSADPWARCGAFFCDLNGPRPPDLPPGSGRATAACGQQPG